MLRITETAVVESWREALRLCTTICHDADVDTTLEAILTPQPDEPPRHGRARAVQAALCLADEPNASDATAERVLRILMRHVQATDDHGYGAATEMDNCVAQLSTTRWRDTLQLVLSAEFVRRTEVQRAGIGGLAGLALASKLDDDKWWVTCIEDVARGDEKDAVRGALTIMDAAWRHTFGRNLKVPPWPKLARVLVKRLKGCGPSEHACAWALYWLIHVDDLASSLKQDYRTVLAYLSLDDAGPESLRLLCPVAAAAAPASSKEVVATLLPLVQHAYPSVGAAAATALGTIRDERAVEPLVLRLDDPDANVRDAVVGALGAIGGERVRQVMASRLDHADADVRRQAVRALSSQLDATTRTLLTSDLYEWGPRRDPREPVTLAFAQRAATKLQFSLDDVKARYEALAPQFHLRLEWLTDATASTPAAPAKPRRARAAKATKPRAASKRPRR